MVRGHLESQQRENRASSKIWAALFAVTLIWLAVFLSWEITRPWINGVDYNGAVWSQAAHNILRAGLGETSGASSGFYFGPLPIPAWGYYLHHPPLLHLVIAFLFTIFGEHEWVARLVPVGCSLISVVLLWLLVKSCAGPRTATLSAAVFSALPMQLRYGPMVNFEPCVLMLMLGALFCLRWHQVSGKSGWRYGALAFILVGLWVDWAMYLFVIALCLCWLLHSGSRDRRFAGMICVGALVSAALYLLRIVWLRHDAWEDLFDTFMVRLGTGKGGHFSEWQWINRIADTLVANFLPIGLILGATGAVLLWRARRDGEGFHWLGRATLSVLIMDALFVGLFQNDSYIHEYIAFYALVPVSIGAGIALDRLATTLKWKDAPFFGYASHVVICLIVAAIAVSGFGHTQHMIRRFRILDYHTEEPPDLIPKLGRAIRANFSSDTHVLCNFLPDYGPQLAYYAQRDILNNLSEYRFWDPHLRDPSKQVGGVVWVSPSPSAQGILAKLPAGTKQFLKVGGLTFCLWKSGPGSKGK
jgi:4-amino-4-deoxy-L-arabinose transferase-like glycosyltransferase